MGRKEPADMGKVWARLKWDVRNLFNGKVNPYIDEDNEEPGLKAKRRTGLEDVSHALKNVLYEGWRNRKKR
jgi:hypothetical protein